MMGGEQPAISQKCGSCIGRQDAELHNGFRQDQISRWCTSLNDTGKCRERPILAAMRKAGIGAGGLPDEATLTEPSQRYA
jgi:hypothetical protein